MLCPGGVELGGEGGVDDVGVDWLGVGVGVGVGVVLVLVGDGKPEVTLKVGFGEEVVGVGATVVVGT